MAVCPSLPCPTAASSPYAVFRASDLAWCPAWAPLATIPEPVITASPSRRRKPAVSTAVIQGELFIVQPNVLPFQPHSRPAEGSKPM